MRRLRARKLIVEPERGGITDGDYGSGCAMGKHFALSRPQLGIEDALRSNKIGKKNNCYELLQEAAR